MPKSIRPDQLMDTVGLARKAKELRLEKRLSLTEVAAMVESERTGKPVSRQAVARAENEDVGPEMNGVRIKIIEALTEQQLEGPVWYFKTGS